MKLVGYVCQCDRKLPPNLDQWKAIEQFAEDNGHEIVKRFECESPNNLAELSQALTATDKVDGLLVYDCTCSIDKIKKVTDIKASLERFVRQYNRKHFFSIIEDYCNEESIKLRWQMAYQQIQVEIAKRAD